MNLPSGALGCVTIQEGSLVSPFCPLPLDFPFSLRPTACSLFPIFTLHFFIVTRGISPQNVGRAQRAGTNGACYTSYSAYKKDTIDRVLRLVEAVGLEPEIKLRRAA